MSSGSSQSAAVLRQDTGASKVGTLNGKSVQVRLEEIGQELQSILQSVEANDRGVNERVDLLDVEFSQELADQGNLIELRKVEAVGESQDYTDQKVALLTGEIGNGEVEDQSLFISMIQEAASSRLAQFKLKEKINEVNK